MFKQATVNAASVPSTQTDFPVYVDLARVGITTLAQAQSSRWYEDSAKIVEMPREIVSLTEGHGKYSSLTSTSSLFIDYDGIRADYAVTDTYGRNAVWGDYAFVSHMEGTAAAIDSTGGGDFSENGTVTEVSGAIGNGRSGWSSANYFTTTRNIMTGSALTWQAWHKNLVFNDGGSFNFINELISDTGYASWSQFLDTGNKIRFGLKNTSGTRVFIDSTTGHTDNADYLLHFTYDGSTMTTYANATADANTGSLTGSVQDGTKAKYIGAVGRPTNAPSLSTVLDEVRFRNSALSANWITTEYNNQSDEATFLGTWTEVGGGGGPAAQAARRLFLMGM